jgi:hypothetical protein
MDDIVHVAIAPPDTLDESLVEKVAAIINKDLYGTRLLMAGKMPQLVARCQTTQAAELVAQSLRALGLVVVVCDDAELRKSTAVSFSAYTMKLGEGEAIFWDKGGEMRSIRTGSVFMILKGTRQTNIKEETTNTRMKLNIAATLLTGGIPVFRSVKEEPKNQSIQTEYFLRLYDRMSLEPSVEIFQHSFDYSVLGTKMASSSLANLNRLITELKKAFPRAVFDDRLTKPSRVAVPFARPADNVETNCKLIYLCHQARNSGPTA